MSTKNSLLPLLNFSLVETEGGDVEALAKAALIFVEGKHKDSMGREHLFDPQRIQKFVQNTNKHLEMGGRLPVQMDHKKTQDFNIGDVESLLYTKVITEDDLPNKKFRHLIGRVGVFADNVVIKSKKAIEDVKAKIINTLSPGLDPLTESFIEVSATPTPAIIGPALFSQSGTELDNIITFEMMPDKMGTQPQHKGNGKAFSFEQLRSVKQNVEKKEEEYEELTEDLFEILCSLYNASEEELAAQQVSNPIEASYEAIEYFLSELEEMFELTEDGNEDDEEDPKDKYLKNKKTTDTVAGTNSNTPYPLGKRESDFSRQTKKTIGFVL
jgi:hypothetical protein